MNSLELSNFLALPASQNVLSMDRGRTAVIAALLNFSEPEGVSRHKDSHVRVLCLLLTYVASHGEQWKTAFEAELNEMAATLLPEESEIANIFRIPATEADLLDSRRFRVPTRPTSTDPTSPLPGESTVGSDTADLLDPEEPDRKSRSGVTA